MSSSVAVIFMVITSISHPEDAKVSIFPNMKECRVALPKVKASLKNDKDVDTIDCIEGELSKEKPDPSKNDGYL